MRIIFFGSPAAALPSMNKILDAGHSIEFIVTQPDKPSGRGKKLMPCPVKKAALELNIPHHQPLKIKNDQLALEKIKEVQPDLNVVVAYGQIIPASIIYLPKFRSVNVHFSLLPKYRGASPVQWALLNGEKKTGVTIFELNEKMDEGDILAQQEVEILPEENAGDLEARLAQIGAELLTKTIAQIDKITPQKQDDAKATYAPKIKKEDGKIDWARNAGKIERQVRAFTPKLSAFTFLYEQRIIIRRGKDRGKIADLSSSPGEILSVKKEGVEVGCGERSVYLIERLQPENRKEMGAHAFSLGAKIKPGDKLK